MDTSNDHRADKSGSGFRLVETTSPRPKTLFLSVGEPSGDQHTGRLIRELRRHDPSLRFRAGSHLVRPGDKPSTATDQGYVSSVAWSPTLDSWIGLAMLKRGRERHGERLIVWDGLRDVYIEAEACNPVFIDPQGEKTHA